MKLRISAEKKAKLSWIGKRVFIGLVVALLGSMLLEMGIYSLADKIVIMGKADFQQLTSFR